MKIGGKTIDGPKTALLVLPRESGDIVFKFIAVTNDDEFDKLCPRPLPPKTMKVGIGIVENVEDDKYREQLAQRGAMKQDWFLLKSLAPSNIEWDTVKPDDMHTWANWQTDLKAAGFSVAEVNTIFSKFVETNMITDDMLAEARQRFLASQQAAQ